MLRLLIPFLWAFFWLGSGGWRVPTILTLATLALCYTLMALAVYWVDVLVYGYTRSEAFHEAVSWLIPEREP